MKHPHAAPKRRLLTSALLLALASPLAAQDTTGNPDRPEPAPLASSGTAGSSPEASVPAQDPGDEARITTLGEVIVTATKRETNLMKTPISVTVFGQEELDRRGINNARTSSRWCPTWTCPSTRRSRLR